MVDRKYVAEALVKEYGCDKVSGDTFECRGGWRAFLDDDALVAEVYGEKDEIVTPAVLAQHGSMPEPSEVEEWAAKRFGREFVERLRREAEAEYEKMRGDYIGTAEDVFQEMLDNLYAKELEKLFEEEAREWESQPAERKTYGGVEVVKAPTVVEVYCQLNIPHYHYYKGHVCRIPLSIPEELFGEALEWCLD